MRHVRLLANKVADEPVLIANDEWQRRGAAEVQNGWGADSPRKPWYPPLGEDFKVLAKISSCKLSRA